MNSLSDIENDCLNLLTHALEKQKISRSIYSILERSEDKLCLLYDNGNWKVSYFERGSEYIHATFINVVKASEYFYWDLTNTPSHFKFRQEWKQQPI